MEKTNLGYEIKNHYKKDSFTRDSKFTDSEERIYAPICVVSDNQLLIDVGGTDRQVPLAPHLEDLIHSFEK